MCEFKGTLVIWLSSASVERLRYHEWSSHVILFVFLSAFMNAMIIGYFCNLCRQITARG